MFVLLVIDSIHTLLLSAYSNPPLLIIVYVLPAEASRLYRDKLSEGGDEHSDFIFSFQIVLPTLQTQDIEQRPLQYSCLSLLHAMPAVKPLRLQPRP